MTRKIGFKHSKSQIRKWNSQNPSLFSIIGYFIVLLTHNNSLRTIQLYHLKTVNNYFVNFLIYYLPNVTESWKQTAMT